MEPASTLFHAAQVFRLLTPDKLLSVEQWGTGKWTSMYSTFYNCTNLAINAEDAPDLSNVTSMYNMFVNTGLTTEESVAIGIPAM